MSKKKLKFYFPWLVSGALVVVSFILSSQGGEASHKLSGKLAEFIFDFFSPLIFFIKDHDEWFILYRLDGLLRSAAHVSMYFFLSLTIMLGFRGLTHKKSLVFFGTFILILILSLVDEFHQYFTVGRNSSFGDIASDIFGAFLAFFFILVLLAIKKFIHWLAEFWPYHEDT